MKLPHPRFHRTHNACQMLKETLVAYCPSAPTAPEEPHAPLPRHASLQHRSSMADLLDRVVKSLLRSSSVGGQVCCNNCSLMHVFLAAVSTTHRA